jgi:hypothetical protein
VHLDAEPRALDDQVVNDLVEERIELLALAEAPVVLGIDLRLDVQRRDDLVRVEEQLEDRVEQLAHEPEQPAMRLVQRRVLELVVLGRGTDDTVFLELLDEVGSHAARIEELLELDARQLLQLRLGVVHAALLANARADLPHDLLDVDGIGTNT